MATTKVSVRACKVRGRRLWRVRRWEAGKPKRTFFKTKDEAEAEAARVRDEIASTGMTWQSLPAPDRQRLIQLYTEAKKNGVELSAKRTETKNAAGPALSVVIGELIEAKRSAGRSKRYLKGLKIVLDQFTKGIELLPIGKVGLTEVEMFLDSKKLASRSTLRARLSSLFRFAVRRGYRVDNPCARLEAIKVTRRPPAILTTAQFQKCIEVLSKPVKPSKHSPMVNYRHARPWFVLTTLCGLRPEEAQKTTKGDIHFKEGWIRVEAQTTKVRQRRIVYPRSEAMRLLKAVMGKGRLPLTAGAARRARHRLRAALGFKEWPKDITRHTAASYWLAGGASAASVADNLGNSEKVLRRDYKALVTRKDADSFWECVSKMKGKL